jgi:L-alanine-DL-glutamate epimerase-like enolase superfamily enzyme
MLDGEPSARCALEMAVLDALTRHLRLPLWAFFGGQGAELETDMTITAGDARHAGTAALAIVARGIQALKVKVGALSPREDADRLEAVHRAAPGARLTADANAGYTPPQALQFLEELRARRVPLELFEQPVDRESWIAFMRTKPASPVLVCADESARTAREVIDLVREQAIDAINLKPMKSGVLETLAMWQIATSAGVKLMIGGMLESPLAMSFSTHLAAGLGGFNYVDLDTPMFMKEHPFTGGFVQTGARLDVSHVAAGHGVGIA